MKTSPFRARLIAMLAGEVISKTGVVAAFAWLARVVDPSVYGDVEWALSVTMLVTLAADAGLSTWGAAQVATRPGDAGSLVRRVGRLRLALAVPAYLGLLIVAGVHGGRGGTALMVFGLGLFLTPFSLQYLFNGLHETRWAALGNAVRGMTFAAAVFLLVHADSAPVIVGIAELLGVAAMVAVHVAVLRMIVKLRLDSPVEAGGVRSLLARSWPVSAAELTWGLHWYAGVILLGFLAGPADVAWQSASLRLVLAIHTGVWLYLYVLLPGLARVVVADPDAWRRLFDASLRVAAWAGFGIALVVSLAAETLLRTVFGDGFAASAPLLRAIIWVIPIAWLSGHLRYSLIAAEHPRKDYHAALAGAATTVLLTLALVPSLHSLGAGIALLCGTVANAVAAWILARRTLPAFTAPRSAAQSAVWCLAAVVLGTLLTPVAGDVQSAGVAGGFFVIAAAIVERQNVSSLLHSVSASLVEKARSNADART